MKNLTIKYILKAPNSNIFKHFFFIFHTFLGKKLHRTKCVEISALDSLYFPAP